MTRPRWLAPFAGDLVALLCALGVGALFALCVVCRIGVAVVADVHEAWRRFTA
jgi:hypothetical protein